MRRLNPKLLGLVTVLFRSHESVFSHQGDRNKTVTSPIHRRKAERIEGQRSLGADDGYLVPILDQNKNIELGSPKKFRWEARPPARLST